MSWVDAPFFAHSEFIEVLCTMGLDVYASGRGTRAQWGRLRAAMCNAFDGGHASPRRLSEAFLAMERRDLAQYRADARAILRGNSLPAASDPASGTPLRKQWWARYKFEPPNVPATGTRVLVRGAGGVVHVARFMGLRGDDMVRIRVEGPAPTDSEVPDVDVMIDGDASPPGMRTPPAARRVAFGSSPGTPQARVVPSPRAAIIAAGTAGGEDVEAEVDVGRLATLIRVYEQRQCAVDRLRRANNAAEAEVGATGVASVATRTMAEQAICTINDLTARTAHLLPTGTGSLASSASPARVAQRLDEAFGAVAPPPRTVLQPPRPDAVAVRGGVDFESTEGTLLLGKSLTRIAMSRIQHLPHFAKLRTANATVKTDVLECVTACVALLTRARCSKNGAVVEEMLQLLQHRFPNMPDSLRAAAAELGTACSDSR